MSNKICFRSNVEFNQHMMDTLNNIKLKKDFEKTITAIRVALYVLDHIEMFAIDFKQVQFDLRHKLKKDRMFLSEDVKQWLKM